MARFKLKEISVVAFCCFVASSLAQESEPSDRAFEFLQEAIPAGTLTDRDSFVTNGFDVESLSANELAPGFVFDGTEYQQLWITAEDIFRVVVEKERSGSMGGGVSIFHRDSGVPMLGVSDRDGDGRLELLTYTVLDDAGERATQIIDYEADGQADVRIHYGQGFFEIWHADRWYPSEEREGNRGIVVDGEFRLVVAIDNRLTVQ